MIATVLPTGTVIQSIKWEAPIGNNHSLSERRDPWECQAVGHRKPVVPSTNREAHTEFNPCEIRNLDVIIRYVCSTVSHGVSAERIVRSR
jgi:hypothetical protein